MSWLDFGCCDYCNTCGTCEEIGKLPVCQGYHARSFGRTIGRVKVKRVPLGLGAAVAVAVGSVYVLMGGADSTEFPVSTNTVNPASSVQTTGNVQPIGNPEGTGSRVSVPSQPAPNQPTPNQPTQGNSETGSVETIAENVCGVVNGFTITAITEPKDCDEALAVTHAYTTAIQEPDAKETLGSGLFWSNEGWLCSRNFDNSGVTAASHGLFCQRGGTQISLVS